MSGFLYRHGEMLADGVALARIAEQVGTPFYCYSAGGLRDNYAEFSRALDGMKANICYALKANSNQAVIRLLAREGAGADVVSQGELMRALKAGVPADRIIFSGVGKTRGELAFALNAGIMQINVESEPELGLLNDVAKSMNITAAFAVRVNPDVDAGTHAKITTGRKENKFGIDIREVAALYDRARDLANLKPVGVAVHIGSQITELAPYRAAYDRVAELVGELRRRGHEISRIDLGGGIGIRYADETPPAIADYIKIVQGSVGNLGCHLSFEPGRRLVGEAGVLVSRVIYVKPGHGRNFVIVDAAMNDLIRPTLYEAYHEIVPASEPASGAQFTLSDVVGPVCETGDYLAQNREMPPLAAGDLLVIKSAGAYGAVMASTYNTRPLVPEVLVDGERYAVIRPRQSIDQLIGLDQVPDWLA
jgi:diaminopimelate decarboxylase